jgi:hypothetical protein
MQFPNEYQLELKKHYLETHDDPEALAFCAARNELFDRAQRGELFGKFIDGDRKGSIARLTIDPKYNQKRCEIRRRPSYYRDSKETFELDWYFFAAIAKWDKPKRSCHSFTTIVTMVVMKNHQSRIRTK